MTTMEYDVAQEIIQKEAALRSDAPLPSGVPELLSHQTSFDSFGLVSPEVYSSITVPDWMNETAVMKSLWYIFADMHVYANQLLVMMYVFFTLSLFVIMWFIFWRFK